MVVKLQLIISRLSLLRIDAHQGRMLLSNSAAGEGMLLVKLAG